MKGKGAVWAVIAAVGLGGCQAGSGPEAGGAPAADKKAPRAPGSRPTAAPVVLEEGTALLMKLETTVSTATAKAGDVLTAKLLEPVRQGERVLVPEGAEVRGKVVTAVRSGKTKGRARLVFDFDRLTVDGRAQEIATSSIDITAENSKKRDAAIIGGGAGAGAIIGGIAKGGKGAAVGAIIGGAAGGGAVLATRGKEVVLEAGTHVQVKLRESAKLDR